jgi:hypothetical protein
MTYTYLEQLLIYYNYISKLLLSALWVSATTLFYLGGASLGGLSRAMEQKLASNILLPNLALG